MSKTEATVPLRERQEAMHRLWPDHWGYCTLRPRFVPTGEPGTWRTPPQCGVELVPLTVDTDYLSVRCPSCRVGAVPQRIVPLNG